MYYNNKKTNTKSLSQHYSALQITIIQIILVSIWIASYDNNVMLLSMWIASYVEKKNWLTPTYDNSNDINVEEYWEHRSFLSLSLCLFPCATLLQWKCEDEFVICSYICFNVCKWIWDADLHERGRYFCMSTLFEQGHSLFLHCIIDHNSQLCFQILKHLCNIFEH